jgi:predicted phage-related endonuclease
MWNHPTISYIGASDDGHNLDDNSILEIKAMGKKAHEETAQGIIPPYYLCQVQYNLFVSNADFAEFISFRPEDETMHIVKVLPDKEYQAKIVAAVSNFWLNHVVPVIPPPMTEKDYYLVDRPDLDMLLSEWESLTEQQQIIDARITELKEKIKPYTATHTHVTNKAGYKIVMGKRDGGYDYKKFIADTGISEETLKPYKKKDVAVFTVKAPAASLKIL